MQFVCWRYNLLYLYQYDALPRQSLGCFLRCTALKYHVQKQQHLQHQQLQHKHTQAKTIVDKTTITIKEKNCCKSNNMNASSSSVFSSAFTKEEPLAKMQLKNVQQQHQATQPQSPPSPPVPHMQTHSLKTENSTIYTIKPTAAAGEAKNFRNSVNIPYDVDWLFERLRNPNRLWLIVSQIVVFAVGLFSKIVLVFMNKTKVYNRERLIEAIAKRPIGVPLVTVSNHHSCFDDPGLWGILPVRYVCNTFKIRWSMAAHDICFTNKYHASFFMFGKCIPVIRGYGVYQDAVDICVQKVKLGHWVHVFPEGKVNMTKEEMRLKWGVGRIIYESSKVPVIIPMWHEGMDDVLPNVEPYIIKWGKKVTLNIGKPIDMNDFINDLKSRDVSDLEARKLITDKIQEVFHHLRLETEELHKKNK